MDCERISKEDESGHLSYDALNVNPEKQSKLIAKEYDISREQPTPEQLLVREAVKYLTPKQRAVWEYYNYDRFTHDEIASKLRITQQAVQQRIAGAEKKIVKWVQSNLGTYKLLKGDLEK